MTAEDRERHGSWEEGVPDAATGSASEKQQGSGPAGEKPEELEEQRSLAVFGKSEEEGKRLRRTRWRTGFKIKQVLLFWKMNGGC